MVKENEEILIEMRRNLQQIFVTSMAKIILRSDKDGVGIQSIAYSSVLTMSISDTVLFPPPGYEDRQKRDPVT